MKDAAAPMRRCGLAAGGLRRGGRAVPLPHLILLKHAVMRLYVSDDSLQRGAVARWRAAGTLARCAAALSARENPSNVLAPPRLNPSPTGSNTDPSSPSTMGSCFPSPHNSYSREISRINAAAPRLVASSAPHTAYAQSFLLPPYGSNGPARHLDT